MEKRAEIVIDVKGAERAAAAARAALKPWMEGARQVSSAFVALGHDMKGAVTSGNQVSFAGSVPMVQSFELTASKIAAASKRSFESVKSDYLEISKQLQTSPEQIAAYVSAVGKKTYDFSGAEKDLVAFNKFAKETGRDLAENSGLAVAFKRLGIQDADKALKQLRGTAEAFGTVGGPAALADQFVGVEKQVQSSSNSIEKLQALLATLGKGFSPQQAPEIQQAIIGNLSGSAGAYEAHFRNTGALKRGEHIIDPRTGKIDLVKLGELRQRELRKMPRERAMRIAGQQFGSYQAAQAFLDADFKTVEGFTGQESDTDAAQKFAAMPGGLKADADAAKARQMIDIVGHGSFIGNERERLARNVGRHPIAYGLIQNLPKGLDLPFLAYAARLENVEERGGLTQTVRDVYSSRSGLSFKERLALAYGNADVRRGEDRGEDGARPRVISRDPMAFADANEYEKVLAGNGKSGRGGGSSAPPAAHQDLGPQIAKAIQSAPVNVQITVSDQTIGGVDIVHQPGGHQ